MQVLVDTTGCPTPMIRRISRRRVEVYPDRGEWLAARCRGERVGGSDIPRLLGCTPYDTPASWWRRRRGLEAELPYNPSEASRLGRVLEQQLLQQPAPPPCKWFAPGPALALPPGNHVLFGGSVDWMVATPDGFVWDPAWGWGGLEVKLCVDESDRWGASALVPCYRPGVVPQWVALQAYWYLAVTGLPFWDVEATVAVGAASEADVDRGDRRSYRLMADRRFQRVLVRQVGAWRQRHLIENIEPTATEMSLFTQ